MGVRVLERELTELPRALPRGPSLVSALGLAGVLFLLLLSNGRPIGAGDTRPTERAAASLVQEGDLDLDEYPEVEPPFARDEGAHRVSIYPVLSAVLAAPVFALARMGFVLDETGTAYAGKVAASLFSALAAAALYLAMGRRHPTRDAAWAAAVFALGTSVWATSQALWQHPATVLALSVAVLFWVKADDHEAVWAGRAGLPLGVALAARPASVALVAVLGLSFVLRWPRQAARLLLWASPPLVFLLAYQWFYFGSPFRHGFSGTLGRFSEPWGQGQLGLLFSPAKGLFVFTPVALVAVVGLVRSFAKGEKALAGTMGLGVLLHLALIGRWAEWHGGEGFGPRLMTDALPLLFLFLPEGFSVMGLAGTLLAIVSIGVQALGAFAHDYRWERLYQREGNPRAALWDFRRNPIFFYVGERVLRPALPGRRGDRAVVREHPVVLTGPMGSRVTFRDGAPRVSGAERNLGDVLLERGARVEGERLRLRGRFDALFFRVLEGSRPRRLELRVVGKGRGTLYVGERSFSSEAPKWTAYPMNGSFQVRHPYEFARSGGPDIRVSLGRDAGEADIESVSLVPPGEPENVIRLGGS